MRKSINPQALEIQKRFFLALESLMADGKVEGGLRGFCRRFDLNRTKYSRIRNAQDRPLDEMLYKCIDIDALSALCAHYGVSAEWLLLGVGDMLKNNSTNRRNRKKK